MEKAGVRESIQNNGNSLNHDEGVVVLRSIRMAALAGWLKRHQFESPTQTSALFAVHHVNNGGRRF